MTAQPWRDDPKVLRLISDGRIRADVRGGDLETLHTNASILALCEAVASAGTHPDTERLDWLEAKEATRGIGYTGEDERPWVVQRCYDIRGPIYSRGDTLRSAIDDARSVPEGQ